MGSLCCVKRRQQRHHHLCCESIDAPPPGPSPASSCALQPATPPWYQRQMVQMAHATQNDNSSNVVAPVVCHLMHHCPCLPLILFLLRHPIAMHLHATTQSLASVCANIGPATRGTPTLSLVPPHLPPRQKSCSKQYFLSAYVSVLIFWLISVSDPFMDGWDYLAIQIPDPILVARLSLPLINSKHVHLIECWINLVYCGRMWLTCALCNNQGTMLEPSVSCINLWIIGRYVVPLSPLLPQGLPLLPPSRRPTMGAKSPFTKDQDTWLNPVMDEYKSKLAASSYIEESTSLAWKKTMYEDFLGEFQMQLEVTKDPIGTWREVHPIIFWLVVLNTDYFIACNAMFHQHESLLREQRMPNQTCPHIHSCCSLIITLLLLMIYINKNTQLPSTLNPLNNVRSMVKTVINMLVIISRFCMKSGILCLTRREQVGLRRQRSCRLRMVTHGMTQKSISVWSLISSFVIFLPVKQKSQTVHRSDVQSVLWDDRSGEESRWASWVPSHVWLPKCWWDFGPRMVSVLFHELLCALLS